MESGSSEPSPVEFLKLPDKLRCMIYRKVLVHSKPLLPQSADREKLVECIWDQPNQASLYHELLRTCRQVRDEALPELYGTNRFHYTTMTGDFDKPGFPNEHLDMLKHVQVDY